MADKDVSRVSVERAAAVLSRVKRRLRETMPYGPSRVRMSPGEMREAMSKAAPGAVRELISYLGPEQAVKMLLGEKKPRFPTLSQFIEENPNGPEA